MMVLRRWNICVAAMTALVAPYTITPNTPEWPIYITGSAAIGVTSGAIGYYWGRYSQEGQYWGNLQRYLKDTYGYHPCAYLAQQITSQKSEFTTEHARDLYYCMQRNERPHIHDMLTQIDHNITDLASARTAAEQTSRADNDDTAHNMLAQARERERKLEHTNTMLRKNASALDAYFHIRNSVLTRDISTFHEITRSNISQQERNNRLSILLQRQYGYHPLYMAYAYDDIQQLLDMLYADRDALSRTEHTSLTAQVHEQVEHRIQMLEDLHTMLEHDAICRQQRQFLQHHNEYVHAKQHDAAEIQQQYKVIKKQLDEYKNEKQREANWKRAKTLGKTFGAALGTFLSGERQRQPHEQSQHRNNTSNDTPQQREQSRSHHRDTPPSQAKTPPTYDPAENPNAYPPSAPPQEEVNNSQ